MRLEDMILVSVDDHVIEPPTVFQNHIPKRFADRAPRLVFDARTGMQTWKWEAGAAVTPFICAVVTLPNRTWSANHRLKFRMTPTTAAVTPASAPARRGFALKRST